MASCDIDSIVKTIIRPIKVYLKVNGDRCSCWAIQNFSAAKKHCHFSRTLMTQPELHMQAPADPITTVGYSVDNSNVRAIEVKLILPFLDPWLGLCFFWPYITGNIIRNVQVQSRTTVRFISVLFRIPRRTNTNN